MRQEYLEKIIKLRHQLHACPELSLQEHRTKEILMDFLKEHTCLEVVDRGRWFYACCHCGQPGAGAVAFRADFDALPIKETAEEMGISYASRNPGVSHKCGHDGHSAALAGLALELDGWQRKEGVEQRTDGWEPGKKAEPGEQENRKPDSQDVYLIFQHGEEVGGGGEECAQLIKEKGISQVYAVHNRSGYPKGSIVLKSGVVQCASKGLTVSFTGLPAHASQPEDGRNPARAVAELVLAVEKAARQEAYEDLVMATVVQVAVGHKNFGIAASEGEVSMTLRGARQWEMEQMEQQIRREAASLAQRDGLTVSFQEQDVFPETVNDPSCVALAEEAARRAGMEVIPMTELFRASEDFGYYLKACPGAMVYVGNGEDYPQIHTAGYDFNDGILETIVEFFKHILQVREGKTSF